MNLKKGSLAFTLLLALLTAVGPLSTDMYLPSLPAIGKSLDTTTPAVQLTLSVFIAGFAIGQIFYGPISDRFGRKPVLVFGLTGYVAGSLFCYFAPNIEYLIAARFVQALGASAAIVLVRAVVRDLFAGEKAARLLSQLGALMGLVPLIAPIAGSMLEIWFSWRANFAAVSIISAVLLIAVLLLLPETLDPNHKRKSSLSGMLQDFAALLKHRLYQRYLGAIVLAFGGLFVFISTSSFVLQNHFELNEFQYALSFSAAVGGYILGTLIGTRLSRSFSVHQLSSWGGLILGGAGLAMVGFSFLTEQHVWHVLVPMVVYMIGVGLVLPQSMAGAITPFPQMAGTASSLIGFLQNGFAAICGAIAGNLIEFNPNMLVWIIGFLGISNLFLSLAFLKRKKSA